MGTTAVDQELLEGLKATKTRRMHFAFIAKGGSDGALVIHKMKVPNTDIAAAKKKSGGTTVIEGECFYEDGKTVFEMPSPPPATLEGTLKKVIHRETQENVNAVCRFVAGTAAPAGTASGDRYSTMSSKPQGASPTPAAGTTDYTTLQKKPAGAAPAPAASATDYTTLQKKPAGAPQGPAAGSADYVTMGKKPAGGAPSADYVTMEKKPAGGAPSADYVTMEKKPAGGAPSASGGTADYVTMEKKPAGAAPNSAAGSVQYSTMEPREGNRTAGGAAAAAAGGAGSAAAAAATTAAKPKGVIDYAKQVAQKLKDVGVLLKQALQAGRADAQALKALFVQAETHARKLAFDKALECLTALEKLLTGSKPPAAGSATSSANTESSSTANQAPTGNNAGPQAAGNNTSTQTAGQTVAPQPAGGNWSAAPTPRTANAPRPGARMGRQRTTPEEQKIQALLKEDLIQSEWGRKIDLTNRAVSFPDTAKKGANGKIGFLDSPTPNAPPLAIKIPLTEESSKDLAKEVDSYRRMKDNPRFAKCLGIAEVDGMKGLVMEKMKGQDMKQAFSKLADGYKSGKISHEQYWGSVQYTLRETLKGLAELEEAGIVHNDISPDNLFCDEETGAIRVFDFGCALDAGQSATRSPVGKGTVSPDAVDADDQGNLSAGQVTGKHDTYGAGAVAYQAGEKDQFRVHEAPGKIPGYAALVAFKQLDTDGQSKQAIRPADENNPAFTTDEKGNAQHVPGRSGADTEYTKFVNRLMHPDVKQRMSTRQALQQKFLTESLMSDEQAREFLKGLIAEK